MSASSSSTLNLIEFPLSGFNLIEASAGTGKTYALANIYLRYLLERKLDVSQILVVTFTEAATQELRDRIRARIQSLRWVFEGQTSGDELLTKLFEQSEDPQGDLIRLRLAEREIDQAEIYTIHGFCQKLIKSTAWQLGAPLQQNLEEDLRPLREQSIADFWRQHVQSLPSPALGFVRTNWRGPEALSESLRVLLDRRPARVLPDVFNSLAEWEAYQCEFAEIIRQLKERSRQEIDYVADVVRESDLKQLKNKLKWLDDISAWASSDEAANQNANEHADPLLAGDLDLPKYLFRFSSTGLESEVKKGGQCPQHAWFEDVQKAQENLVRLSQRLLKAGEYAPDESVAVLKASFLRLAVQQVLTNIAESKRTRGVMGFDDLISQVAEALANEAMKSQLVANIRLEYAAAMIDEFQDTDPEQYHIFSSLFVGSPNLAEPDLVETEPDSESKGPKRNGTEKTAFSTNLVLIGDPKQAIYSFRGGDMETYLQAKRDVLDHPQGRLFGMDTNWRSSPQMVAAVNDVFAQHPAPFLSEEIPFIHVGAAKESADQWGPALRFQSFSSVNPETDQTDSEANSKAYSKAELDQILADQMAHQVALLLKDEAQDLGIQSADIAILVRTAFQASMMQEALAKLGVRASFEGKESVYESPEAMSVLLVLRMILEPHNLSVVKQCLADPLLGYTDSYLYEHIENPIYLAKLQANLEALQQTWFQQGVLATIRRFIDLFELLSRWGDEGTSGRRVLERRLSNLTQLAELLQAQARVKPEPANLLNWYESVLQDDVAVNDQNRLRLESDEQLVQIVTIHKSKGLEYPVVFLPFMFSTKGAMESWFYEDGKRCLDLMKSDAYKQESENARLAEDLRLLYVALTRAKKRCYVGLSNYKSNKPQALGIHRTALGCLLWGHEQYHEQLPAKPIDDTEFKSALEHLANENLSVEFVDAVNLPQVTITSEHSGHIDQMTEQPDTEYAFRPFGRALNQAWRVQSFSGLLYEHHQLSHAGNHKQANLASQVTSGNRLESAEHSRFSLFRFPKGSQAGTFLHELFESVQLEDGNLIESLRDRVSPGLNEEESRQEHILRALDKARLVSEEDREGWASFLQQWLVKALDFPIPVAGSPTNPSNQTTLRLSDLEAGHYLSEMDFHFSLGELRPSTLNALLKQHGLSEEPIEFHRFKGHLKGAIDLVFEYQGKFYLLDYKSNYLGDSVEDYHPEALKAAIADHRYDLQYLIYCLALHRHLQHRLGEAYSYEEHFGGAIYLFLRGMDFDAGSKTKTEQAEQPGQTFGVYHSLPTANLIEEMDQAMRDSESSIEDEAVI